MAYDSFVFGRVRVWCPEKHYAHVNSPPRVRKVHANGLPV